MSERAAQIATLAPLLRRITVDDDGCWRWNGPTTGEGYPHHRIDGRHVYAHRAMLSGWWGVDIGDHVVHHLCGTKRCLNPTHLVALSNSAHVALHHRLRREARR